MSFFSHLRRAVTISIIFMVFFGFAYALVGVGISQAFFKHQANGSLEANGSSLMGQNWTGPNWFQGRPDSDNGLASGAANLGPRSQTLVTTVQKQIAALQKEGITPTNGLVTTSGSGLDPDIAPADAYAQVNAVAQANNLSVSAVNNLVKSQIHGAQFGFLGSPYVNVLQLNEALSKLKQGS